MLLSAAMLAACGDSSSTGSETQRPDGLQNSSSSIESSLCTDTVAAPCNVNGLDSCKYGTLVDNRDGQVYKTVKIGCQWWMAENLNYRYLQPTEELDSSSFCYNDSMDYCAKYGRLYTWSAAMDSAGLFSNSGKGCGNNTFCNLDSVVVQGVCPEGWHIPVDVEFDILAFAVGKYSPNGGKVLKSASDWGDDGNGSDAFGFSALPAGFVFNGERYDNMFYTARFWSTTECCSPMNSAGASLQMDHNDYARLMNSDKFFSFSVRCVKDHEWKLWNPPNEK
ncbi:fibrobacter succinogenes major paralogous domain-containing protein [uncultured Fibrobacter sp.]|uniref:fibrobacter succinogenes major paralogous domain-containing protein n=1 Tax=uncultured Fibrobacter sp. TaxID=261512 RepID=UPI002608C710|nr:fibrobacter succinogenes major paralogous domain-containing protein [uncultured Fibrobacter sp.]